jgi:hypothetical protein
MIEGVFQGIHRGQLWAGRPFNRLSGVRRSLPRSRRLRSHLCTSQHLWAKWLTLAVIASIFTAQESASRQLLSPGGGDFSFAWYLVQERLQSSARVCSYDRAGSAWSEPGPQPLTLRQEAYELESALKLSGENGPYILVGHSIGGLVVRTFADGYPDESSGMVLVDAPSPDATMGYYGTLVRVRDLAKRTIPPVQTMKTSPPIPISDAERAQALKYKSHKIHPPFDRLPPEIQKLQLWAQMLPPGVAQTEENDYTPEEWQFLYERQQFGYPLGNKPLITMIGMKEAEDRPTSMSVLQDPTLGAVIEAYTREEMPERPKSRQSYSLLIRRHIQPKWGSNVLSEIRPHAVEVLLREMPYSPETKRHIKSMLYRLFELAMKRDWLEGQRNPMSLVRVKGRNRVVEKVVLTPEQMLMVRQNLDDPYLLMSELTCYLGLRICEVLGLMWGDFDPVEKRSFDQAVCGRWPRSRRKKRGITRCDSSQRRLHIFSLEVAKDRASF